MLFQEQQGWYKTKQKNPWPSILNWKSIFLKTHKISQSVDHHNCSPGSACWHCRWSCPQTWWCSFSEWAAQSCWKGAWSGLPQQAGPEVSSPARTDAVVCSQPPWAGTASGIPQNPPAGPSDQTCNMEIASYSPQMRLLRRLRYEENLEYVHTFEWLCKSPLWSCWPCAEWWPNSSNDWHQAAELYWWPSGKPCSLSMTYLPQDPGLLSWTAPQTSPDPTPTQQNKSTWDGWRVSWSTNSNYVHVWLALNITSSTRSSSISLKTVPLIWLGFSAVQLKTGRRNLVFMGFLMRIAMRDEETYGSDNTLIDTYIIAYNEILRVICRSLWTFVVNKFEPRYCNTIFLLLFLIMHYLISRH